MGYRQERGDTLVEVMMAIVILSIVIVGAITMMTRGLQSAQAAVEHTQVRLHINSQTELLRFLRDGYLQNPTSATGLEWRELFAASLLYADTAQSSYGGACAVTAGKRPFYLVESAGNVQITAFNPSNLPTAAAQPGQGLWIEATASSTNTAGQVITPAYVDFQLRACWAGTGSSAQQQTVTAVRLYDPSR